jgi:hypothetical protein
MHIGLHRSTLYYCQILMKLEFSRHFRKIIGLEFHENPYGGGSRVVLWTDVTKLIVALRSLANASERERQGSKYLNH